MPRHRPSLALAAVLALVSGAAGAQETTQLTPGQMLDLSVRMIETGRPDQAVALTGALLARDPGDIDALVLGSQAALAAGDGDTALARARAAWRAAEDDFARYTAARLTANSHALLEQDTRAQFWLRRASQYAPDDQATRAIAEDYGLLRRRNPLSFNLRVSVSPTDNVNNGATEKYYEFGSLGLGVLTGEALPMSGVEIAGSGRLSYRIAESARSRTALTLSSAVKTYRLSEEAKDDVPGAKGSDYGTAQIAVGVEHRWAPEGSEAVWDVSADVGRYWYGGDPYSNFVQGSLGRTWAVGEADRIALTLGLNHSEYLGRLDPESGASLGARWVHGLGNGGSVSLSGTLRDQRSDGADQAYDSQRLGLGWQFGEGASGISVAVEDRDYDTTRLILGDREDRRYTARLTVGIGAVQYYGFEPVLTVDYEANDSTSPRHTTETTGIGFDFRSTF